jgi:hypothetical protein
VVNFEWKIPNVQAESKYQVSARLNLYDKTIETAPLVLRTFQTTRIFSISEPVSINSVMENGDVVARAGLLYSSDTDPSLHYRIVAPDGTCIVGKSNPCLVNGSTAGFRGNTVNVELDGQIYRIRYSGQDSTLERFSITSADPIVGTWAIMLESDEGVIPEAHALEDVRLKVKYRSDYTKLITTNSN